MPIIKKPPRKGYHHGDLRQALIDAAEAILLEKGVEAFTLREAARRAGVSPAAPAHHFGSASGLLSAVARDGFAEFGRRLEEADRAAADPAARLRAQGEAYVRFAMANPAKFRLMFRGAMCDPDWGDLRAVSERSFKTLENAVRDLVGLAPEAPMTLDAQGVLLAAWSMVHGFAHLALEHGFDHATAQIGGEDPVRDVLLPAMLRQLPGKPR